MATFTLGEELNQVLDDIERQRRQAWSEYLEGIKNLRGDRYVKSESEAWDQLQERLKRLENRRLELTKQESFPGV